MNIHEYQAKAVLREFGVPVPRGVPAFSVDEAVNGAKELRGPVWVVKAQIHAGGRGKAGGVKVVKSIDDVKRESTRILGSTLVTHQTGPHGKKVNRLYIEEGSAIDREFYLSALIDRETSRVAFVVSTEGGMDIEEVAHKTPEKILTFSVDPATGILKTWTPDPKPADPAKALKTAPNTPLLTVGVSTGVESNVFAGRHLGDIRPQGHLQGLKGLLVAGVGHGRGRALGPRTWAQADQDCPGNPRADQDPASQSRADGRGADEHLLQTAQLTARQLGLAARATSAGQRLLATRAPGAVAEIEMRRFRSGRTMVFSLSRAPRTSYRLFARKRLFQNGCYAKKDGGASR